MRIQARLRNRFAEIAGTACAIAALGLLSSGARTVRADGEPLMSVDPALVSATARASENADARPASPVPAATARPTIAMPPQAVAVAGSPGSPAAPAFPTIPVGDVENASRPGVSGIEVQPGIVVLNTRGFNYGAPPSPLAPEALKQESAPR